MPRTLLTAVMLVAVGLPARAEIDDGLRFYASFDAAAAPDHAFGTAAPRSIAGEAAVVAGRTGGALRVPDDQRTTAVTYAGPGNLRRDRGTVAFWVRPTWSGAANQPGEEAHRFLFSTGGFRVFWNRDHGSVVVMTGTNRGDGWHWSYSPSAPVGDWRAGQWHHISVTWDGEAQTKALYVDGALAEAAQSEYIPFRDSAADFEFGLAWHAAGDYDEFATWDRVLSAEEIAVLAEQPGDIASTLAAKSVAPEPQWPIRVGMHWWTNHFADAIVAPDEQVSLSIPVSNSGEQAIDAQLRFTLLDFDLRPLRVATREVRLDPQAEETIDLSVAADSPGVFKVRCDVTCGEFEGSRDVASFGVVPDPEHNEPVAESYFGGHPEQTRDFIEQAGRYGLKWARCHDMIQSTRWTRVEPERGEWAFSGDETVTRCVANGMQVLGVFLSTPGWAGDSPASPPREMAEYERYVERTVEHYRDRIKRWEVWNEPHHVGFWKGSAQEYVDLARVTYQAANRVDPECVIVGGGGLSDRVPQFAEEAVDAGLLEYCDMLSYHHYLSADQPPESALEPVRWFREQLAAHGHPEMPLICSEGGLTDSTWLEGLDLPELPPQRVRPPMNWRRGAGRLVQVSALEMAAGVRQRFYYFMKPPPPARAYYDYSALEVTGAPRPKLMAWMAMERTLRGCEYEETVDADALHAEIFVGAIRAVAVAWADDGAQASVDALPDGASVLDLMGNGTAHSGTLIVTDEPIYVVTNPDAAGQLGDDLRLQNQRLTGTRVRRDEEKPWMKFASESSVWGGAPAT